MFHVKHFIILIYHTKLFPRKYLSISMFHMKHFIILIYCTKLFPRKYFIYLYISHESLYLFKFTTLNYFPGNILSVSMFHVEHFIILIYYTKLFSRKYYIYFYISRESLYLFKFTTLKYFPGNILSISMFHMKHYIFLIYYSKLFPRKYYIYFYVSLKSLYLF
jgi:hypothetical protein